MEEQQHQTHSRRSYIYDSKRGGSRKKLFAIIGGILIVLIILIIGGVALSGNNDQEQDEDIFATPATQAPTNTPTPTPEEKNVDEEETDNDNSIDDDEDEDEEETTKDTVDGASGLDRADFTILVQNGSGVTGAAGRLSDVLGDLGYTISSTENADNSDYVETEIKTSSNNKELLKLLERDVSEEYTIGNTSTDYGGDEDAVIIIGKE